MLEDYLCSHQTKLKVLSRKELKMLQKIIGKLTFRGY